MRNLLVLIAVAFGIYTYSIWKPSTVSIASEIAFSNQLSYKGHNYKTSWVDTESIVGYIRRIDRHYDKNVPIITYDLVITTEDFNNPDIVKLRHNGGGNYYWSSKTKPKGSLVVYHTVPASITAQTELDALTEGTSVTIQAKVSTNSELRSDSGAFIKLMHSNHKLILVEGIL
ncbi:MAG: hypothetical protein KZQ89_16465 [Candidatus Thiodiazotropha sp. (ex Lucinoma kastoroae)]|nr:hypothetical protein [Candidatus Thiodiazotropha sp. (ex Lucinoma kastoroae)]MCU7858538.1 hypothetical protein [Candidatus Thiodiazotropha sp. (ex Lucinoma kastoroae)]